MVGPALEALAGGPGQGRQTLGGRGELAVGEAGLDVEGGEALATAAAVVVRAVEGEWPQSTDDVTPALAVVRGGTVAVRAGQAGPLVAVFF